MKIEREENRKGLKKRPSFFKRNRTFFQILTCIVFTAASIWKFYDYSLEDGVKMDLVSGIVHGILALINAGDLIDDQRKKKKNMIPGINETDRD